MLYIIFMKINIKIYKTKEMIKIKVPVILFIN